VNKPLYGVAMAKEFPGLIGPAAAASSAAPAVTVAEAVTAKVAAKGAAQPAGKAK
jgi:hypothetical protein